MTLVVCLVHSDLMASSTNSPVVGGDSGAWIVSNSTGRVAGHVLAERTGLTYMCAMALLFQDMQQTLHACRINLPGPKDPPSHVDKKPGLLYTTVSSKERVGFRSQKGEAQLLYDAGSASRAKSKVAEAAISKPRTGWWTQSVRN